MSVKTMQVKGKCLIFERTRYNKQPVLFYYSIKTIKEHVLTCTICKTVWTAGTKEDVMMQKGAK